MQTMPSEEEARLEGERAQSAQSYKNTLAERDSALAEMHATRGPGSAHWQRAKSKLDAAEEKYRAIFAKLHRLSDRMAVPPIFALLAALTLAAIEAPINKFMLDNILKGSNFESYIFSMFMTLILLLLAHIAGRQARQIYGAYEERFYVGNIVSVVVIFLLLAVCVGALTIGRAAYSVLGSNLPGGEIFAEIGRQIQAVGLWTAFVNALSDQGAFFLAAMNTAGIAGAFFLAFITHDSDKNYQSALDEREKANRQLNRYESAYGRAIERIGRKFRPTLTNIAAAYGAQNARIIALKRGRNAELTEEDRGVLSSQDEVLNAAREHIRLKAKPAADKQPAKTFEGVQVMTSHLQSRK